MIKNLIFSLLKKEVEQNLKFTKTFLICVKFVDISKYQ